VDEAKEFPEIDPLTVPDTLEGADLSQIQAILFRGWGTAFKWSTFLFVEVSDDVAAARAWLAKVRAQIAWADNSGPTELPTADGAIPARLQLALTTRGMRKLGLDRDVIQRFPFELKAGMERRARVLGDDVDDRDTAGKNLETLEDYESDKPMPKDWKDQRRGGIDLSKCDAMILLYARTSAERQRIEDAQRKQVKDAGGRIQTSESSSRWMEKEPFGFADGLSQPRIRGIRGKKNVDSVPTAERNVVSAGEFLLGYRNEYNKVPKSPKFPLSHATHPGVDVGKNGTFLVFRKLEQNVLRFWKTFAALGKRYAGQPVAKGHTVPTDPHAAANWLAARAMGRWTNGNSTMTCPFDDGGERQSDDKINDFVYESDPDGLRCPIGSHVRRANPRDQRGGPIEESWKVVKRHRVLRRGRAYGRLFDAQRLLAKIIADDGATDAEIAAHAALPAQVEETDAAPAPDPTDETSSGLLFICLQANITHGFEFVQQIWNNNPGFHGVFQEPDVIAGPGGSRFSIPAEPVRLRLEDPFPDAPDKDPDCDDRLGMPRLVVTRGGGYFFVPSRDTVDLLITG
jgi:deferrochelatase/peroxidase EfeB